MHEVFGKQTRRQQLISQQIAEERQNRGGPELGECQLAHALMFPRDVAEELGLSGGDYALGMDQ
jgi:hypothetical protein